MLVEAVEVVVVAVVEESFVVAEDFKVVAVVISNVVAL